jgi:nitrite reductase/ring-hydroxylating ferredoxin subunit
MGLLKRILGICRTSPPKDQECWRYSQGKLEIDLGKARELADRDGAIRLEGKGLRTRILVFHGNDGKYHALTNKCTHIGGRRVDPVAGSQALQCCSVMGSTYSYDGQVVSGPARKPLTAFGVESRNGKLIVSVA